MTKILVTGATGTVGRQVALALAKVGADVRAAVRDPAKARDLADAGAQVVPFDFEDGDKLTTALAGVDRVFLLTPSVEDATPMIDAAIAAAANAGVSFVLRMSASGADASSDNKLGREHGVAENIVKNSGLQWAILRPTFFMDNVINYGLASIHAEGKTYGAAGSGKTSYISTADIADVAAAILRNPEPHHSQTYTLTGRKALSEQEVADLVAKRIDKPIQYISLEPEQLRAGMTSQGAPAWMADGLVGLETVKANGWAAAVSPDVEQILARQPESFDAFLDRNRERLS